MEININCDLGEKSKLHNNENDPILLEIVNSASVACGYHAGDEETMDEVIKISKKKECSNSISVTHNEDFLDNSDVLINLSDQDMDNCQSANRLIEIIPNNEELKKRARKKYKEYKESNYDVRSHNIK